MGRGNQLPPDTSVPMLQSLQGIGGVSPLAGMDRFAPAFAQTAVPEFTRFPAQEPTALGVEDIYAQPGGMGRWEEFMQPTPEETRFSEFLGERPTREEHEPGLWRNLALAGTSALTGGYEGPRFGLETYMTGREAPYRRALEEWQGQAQALEKQAEMAGERRRTGGTLARSIMQNERIIKNQIADNLLAQRREARLAEQARNQGWQRTVNELTGEIEFVRPGTGERRSMGQMVESIPEKQQKADEKYIREETDRRWRQLQRLQASEERQERGLTAAEERQQRALAAGQIREDRPVPAGEQARREQLVLQSVAAANPELAEALGVGEETERLAVPEGPAGRFGQFFGGRTPEEHEEILGQYQQFQNLMQQEMQRRGWTPAPRGGATPQALAERVQPQAGQPTREDAIRELQQRGRVVNEQTIQQALDILRRQ